jgi:D-lactate dehydrogenase
MKMLMFDFRESERKFFNRNDFPDFDITFIKEPLNEMSDLTQEQYDETDIISVFISSNLCPEVLSRFKNLRVIATRSTGFNHIDVKHCSQNNIAVFNVEEYGQTSVAQYTFALIMALVRNLFPAYLDIQRNYVNHADYEGRDLESLTIGIVGCGSIGGAVSKIANFFNMKVLVYSLVKHPDVNSFVEYVSFDELLSQSDIISLHLPYTAENYHMFGEQEFAKMKSGAYFINTARGELIDIVALYENLLSRKLKGAALDVLECEYLALSPDNIVEDIKSHNSSCVASALITQKLLGMSNVIITPHIAYNTQEAVDKLLETTFNNIRDFHKGLRNNQVC